MENLLNMQENVMLICLLGWIFSSICVVVLSCGLIYNVINSNMDLIDFVFIILLFLFVIVISRLNIHHNNFLNNIEGKNKIYVTGESRGINNWVEENTQEPYIYVIKEKGKYCYKELHSSEKHMRNIMGFKSTDKGE